MLHTLIPPIERKKLRHEYRIRALTVFLCTMSIAGIMGIGSLFPAFIRAGTEESNANDQLSAIKRAKDKSGLTAIQQQVAIGQKLLTILSSNPSREHLSDMVENLVRERGTLKISSIAVNYTATTSAQASIRGVAPTRDSLLAFKSRLETDNPGSKISLPVSELAKGTNIPFSITITLKMP